MLFDAHCHIQTADLEEYIKKSKKKNVNYILANSLHLEDFFSFPDRKEILKGIAVYPLYIKKPIKEYLKKIEANIEDADFIGEVGLDFKYEKTESGRKKQIDFFKAMIDLSKEYSLYLNIHSRSAQKKVLQILEENRAEKVILHWFIASRKILKRAEENGFYITIGQSFLKEPALRYIYKEIDPENILFETDYPVNIMGYDFSSDLVYDIYKSFCETFRYDNKKIEILQEKALNKIRRSKQ